MFWKSRVSKDHFCFVENLAKIEGDQRVLSQSAELCFNYENCFIKVFIVKGFIEFKSGTRV